MANEEHYPRRLHGRTAAEVWRARAPISPEERRRFRDAVDRLRRSLAEELQSSLFEALNRGRPGFAGSQGRAPSSRRAGLASCPEERRYSND